MEILSHTNGSPWVDEGTTVTFATKFHRLTKAETAVLYYTHTRTKDSEDISLFAVQKKERWLGSIGQGSV